MHALIDLVLPPACAGCDRLGSLLCDRCLLSFRPSFRDRDRFVADYAARLAEAYEPQRDGRVLFPFRRVFLVAYR